MKLYYSLLLIFVLLLSCNSKNKSTHELKNILKSNRNEAYFHKDEIIFSTLHLESSKILTLEEIRRVMKVKEGRNG